MNFELSGRLTHERQEYDLHMTSNYPGMGIIHVRTKRDLSVINADDVLLSADMEFPAAGAGAAGHHVSLSSF